MSPKLKTILIISAKQALGVIIGNSGLWAAFPQTFNFHDTAGMLAFAKSAVVLIATAEGKVWIPKLLAWINSPTPGAN